MRSRTNATRPAVLGGFNISHVRELWRARGTIAPQAEGRQDVVSGAVQNRCGSPGTRRGRCIALVQRPDGMAAARPRS